MDEEQQLFVLVAHEERSEDGMELPMETNGTVLLSTIQAQFPSASGLKYKSSLGGWRGIRAENNVLDPPHGGWGEKIYIVTESDALKRKSSVACNNESSNVSKSAKLLDDLIVLGLPYTTTEEELKDFFTTSCGELSFSQLKVDRNTGMSRGFGFIRFKTEESAQAAIKGQYEIEGRKLVVRISQRKGDAPTKLFVGRLPKEVSNEEVREYFSEFGDLSDCFLPSPFRGFAFVTFTDEEDAKKVLRRSHSLKGSRLNVSAAEPKSERQHQKQLENFPTAHNTTSYSKPPPPSPYQRNNTVQPTYSQNMGGPHYQQNPGYDPRSVQGNVSAPVQNDVVGELKDMLLTLINNRK